MESFYLNWLPLKIEQLTNWVKCVFGLYGEALFEIEDEGAKVNEEALYKIGYTLFTGGENMDEKNVYDELITSSFVKQFYDFIWYWYGMPAIDNFGYELYHSSPKTYKLALLNEFKDLIVNEYKEVKSLSLQCLEQYSSCEHIKQKSVVLHMPVYKGKLKRMHTTDNLFKREEAKKEKIKIYLNGKKMTHLQACRFYGEDYYSTKQYQAIHIESCRKELLELVEHFDKFMDFYNKLPNILQKYIMHRLLVAIKHTNTSDYEHAMKVLEDPNNKQHLADILKQLAAVIAKIERCHN